MAKSDLANKMAEKVSVHVGGLVLDEIFADKMNQGSIQIGTRINKLGMQTRQSVRIPDDMRLRHLWVLGRTGSGKSTLLLNMIIQDMLNGLGLCVIDPKGDLVDGVLKYVPAERINDVVLIDLTDSEHVFGLNMFERTHDIESHIVYEHFMAVFTKLLGDSMGVTVKQLLAYTILTLLEVEGSTIADISDLLLNDEFRAQVLQNVSDPEVQKFWNTEWDPQSDQQKRNRATTITNKLTEWTASKSSRYVVYQPESTINLREIMDRKKLLLVKIPQGIMGEGSSAFLGALLVTKLQVTVMQRSGLPPSQKPPFILYVDEFQNFVTSSFTKILSEARSYGLGLVVANQYEQQLTDGLAEALKQNVAGSIECYMKKRRKYGATFRAFEDDSESEPASVKMLTLPQPKRCALPETVDRIKEASRFKYTIPVKIVEEDVARIRAGREGIFDDQFDFTEQEEEDLVFCDPL